jgi:hypothetical protein
MEQLFTQIEERYRFVLPEAFREFWRRGFCNILGFGRPGPHCLDLPDLEWMPLTKIITFKFKSYQLPGFVPFAISGSGDHWCWQPAFIESSKTRVLFCCHDCYDADIYAPDFISAIYRLIIEHAAGMERDAEGVKACRRRLGTFASVLAPLISPAWQQTLSDIVHGTVKTGPSPGSRPTDLYFLVSPRERNDILRRDLGWESLDAKFRWTQPAA